MIIGQTRKSEIKQKILTDLFSQAEVNIIQQKKKVTEESYYIWLKQYQEAIAALPPEFIHHTTSVYMKVAGDSKYSWGYASPDLTPIIAVVKDSYRPDELPFPVPDQYKDTVVTILQEEKELKAEKEAMSSYLKKSMTMWNTTAKLKKNWPEQLHKYIPTDPPRKPRKKKPVSTDTLDIEAPVSAIQQRLTTNLLENS